MDDLICQECKLRVATPPNSAPPKFCSFCGAHLHRGLDFEAERLFAQAIELEGAERNAFLDRECHGKDDLRRRLDDLLNASESGGGVLDTLLDQRLPSTEHRQVSLTGVTVDKYKLLQQIGEGGFGVVYMAEQLHPVKRKVALKVVKPGMDSKAVMARFEAERQALAMMDHSHIASVFDGGTTKEGRPYFVMELVKGVPITTYCDDNKLNIRDRLELFINTCEAVQHAHQKGIIHRDIKPSNVLITLHDGKPVVKVIDFGVAKAMHSELTEKTLFTAFGQMIGTPQYMSPEQAEMSGLDIDTRSDIYSLAVLLYELLTGTTPLESNELKAAGLGGVQKLIKDTEPPKPSTRVSSIGHRLTHIAAERSVAPDRLRREIQGDLDWIVMKALDKDRARRYETATGLANDITRFVNDEPVNARPPSIIYQLRKLARKHRTLAWSAGFVSTALCAGLFLSASGMRIAQKERDVAQTERDRAQTARDRANGLAMDLQVEKDNADRARTEAEELREKAERAFYTSQMFKASGAITERRGQRRVANTLHQWRPKDPESTDLRGWEWFYLAGVRAPDTLTLCDEPAYSASWSPIDNRIASTFFDGSIRVHDVDDLTKVVRLQAHRSPVIVAKWHATGKWLATVALDGEWAIWNTENWNLMRREAGDASNVIWSPTDARIAIVSDKSVSVTDVTNSDNSWTQEAKSFTVSWSSNGRWLASDVGLGRFGVLDANSGAWVHQSDFHGSEANNSKCRHRLRDNPDATPFLWLRDRLIVATHRSFRHIAIPQWEETRIDIEHEMEVRLGDWSPVGGFITSDSPRSGFSDYELYDFNSGDLKKIQPLDSESYAGTWSSDGRKFAYSTRHATVYVWDCDTEKQQEFPGLASGPGLVAWNCTDDKIVAVSDQVQVLEVQQSLDGSVIAKPEFWSLGADGWSIATNSTGDRKVRVYDFATGKQQYSLESPVELSGVLWSPYNAKWVAAVSRDGKEILTWNTESRQLHDRWPVNVAPGHQHEYATVAMDWSSRDNLAMVLLPTSDGLREDGTIDIWDVHSRDKIKSHKGAH